MVADAMAGTLFITARQARDCQTILRQYDTCDRRRGMAWLRTRPYPLTWDQAQRLRGARRAGPPPAPATSPVTVQRRASNSGIIMVAGQKIALGRIYSRKVVSVRVSPDTITIEIGADDIRTIRRTTDQPVRNLQAQRSRKAANVS
jgi:hypothetical protein